MRHVDTCECYECTAKEIDITELYDDLELYFEKLRKGDKTALKWFVRTAEKIDENSEDSLEFIIGEFILSKSYDDEDKRI